jgi:hypothetical protein
LGFEGVGDCVNMGGMSSKFKLLGILEKEIVIVQWLVSRI